MELSIVREKLETLERKALVPKRRSSVLLSLSLRKSEVNQDLIFVRQWVREEGGRVEFDLLER